MFAPAVIEFPSLGYPAGKNFNTLATRRRDEFRGGPIIPISGLGGVGDFDLTSITGGLSLQTLLLLGIGGWAAYRLLFSTTARVRRQRLRDVKKKYKRVRKKIKERMPVMAF